MNETVSLLWFVKEMPEGEEDIELLIGVYSTEDHAKQAIDRLRGQKGFVDFQQGFQIHLCSLNEDSWTEGFIID